MLVVIGELQCQLVITKLPHCLNLENLSYIQSTYSVYLIELLERASAPSLHTIFIQNRKLLENLILGDRYSI